MKLGELIDVLAVGEAEVFNSNEGRLEYVCGGDRKTLTNKLYDSKPIWNAEVSCIGISVRKTLSIILK